MKLKKQKGGFISMLLGTVGANLLGNMFAGKGVKKRELLEFAIYKRDLHLKKCLILCLY